MKKITKEVKLLKGFSYAKKIFSDAENNRYEWFSQTSNHSVHKLRIGRMEKELKSEEGLLLNALVKQEFGEPHNYTEVTYVRLNYTDKFINSHLETIIRSKNDGTLDVPSTVSLLRVQKFSEDSCTRLLQLIRGERPEKLKEVSRALSRFQKLSEEFILENLDLLDIKYLKLSHLSTQSQFKLKMMRELI